MMCVCVFVFLLVCCLIEKLSLSKMPFKNDPVISKLIIFKCYYQGFHFTKCPTNLSSDVMTLCFSGLAVAHWWHHQISSSPFHWSQGWHHGELCVSSIPRTKENANFPLFIPSYKIQITPFSKILSELRPVPEGFNDIGLVCLVWGILPGPGRPGWLTDSR